MPTRSSRSATIAWVALLVAFPIAFMWQGLDVTDTGYSLANMQRFFSDLQDPTTGSTVASCWLSYLVGAVWYQLTGKCGLIGFRVFYLLLIYCLLALAWLPMRKLRASKVLLSLFAGEAVLIGPSLYLPSYNEITALCFLLTALALYRGLVRGRRLWIFAAGICGGVSIFARLPNLAIAGIAVAILFDRGTQAASWREFRRESLPRALRECIVFGLGYLAGIGAVLLVMAPLGHVAAYREMLRRLSAEAADPTYHHGVAPLLRGLLHDYFYASVAGVLYAAGGAALGWVAARSASRFLRSVLCLGVGFALTVLLLRFNRLNEYLWPGVVYATLLAGAAGLLKLNKEFRLLCVLSAILLLATPLGSGNGIYNAVYAMYLAVPVALLSLIAGPTAASREPGANQARDGTMAAGPGFEATWPSAIRGLRARIAGRWGLKEVSIDTAVVGYAILLSMIGFSLIHRWQFTYRDSPDRLAMRATVDHPKLRAVFTTPSRAQALQELLQQLRALVKKDDYLLDHMQIPLLYFLTETRPYLYSTWANLYEPPAFQAAMAKALASRPSLPVCVRTKVDTSHPRWPDETYPPSSSRRFVENRHAVESFLQDHHYRKHWENNAFEIWLPASGTGNG